MLMGRYERVETRRKKKKGWVAALVVVLVLAVGLGGLWFWYDRQPKFQDLTIELGTDSVRISDFMTKYALRSKVGFVSDPAQIDLNQVGDYQLTLRQWKEEETVTLRIQDTTAPAVDFVTECVVFTNYVPVASDFAQNIRDMSETSVYFLEEPVMPADYADAVATVVVEDAYGNRTQAECTLSYRWMPETYTLELGQELTPEDLLVDPEKDAQLLEQADLDRINKADIGDYEIVSATAAKSITCTVTVQDTLGPDLQLQEVQRKPGEEAELEDFVLSATDPSGEVQLRLMTQLRFDEEGAFPVTIEAEDVHGNVTSQETMLYVTTDMNPPVISGLDEALSVAKNGTVDYLDGVSAADEETGDCKVSYDASGVDVTTPGTYYVTYTAADEAGNVSTIKRAVEVQPDQEDIDALVKSIAADLSDDPEKLRNYVRDKLHYNSNWGGENPVWYGFTNKAGNCYVHALCLKALYDEKGIESQLIWCTDKSHYWLVVNINGRWLHIDPTPGEAHMRYSLMTDATRYATLGGRNWDRSAWPKCT